MASSDAEARARMARIVNGIRADMRDRAIESAMNHARMAKETGSEAHAREAMRQRDLAKFMDDGIRRTRAELEGARRSL